MKHPITILGAGIAGLTLSQCLRTKGIPSIVYEKAKRVVDRHDYGITLYQGSYRPLLEALKIDEAQFRRKVCVASESETSGSTLRVNRQALERFLREGVDVGVDHAARFFTPSAAGKGVVMVWFENGEAVESELVVGADGVHSVARQIMAAGEGLRVLQYVVFNGKRKVRLSECSSLGLEECFAKPEGLECKIGETTLSITADSRSASDVGISYTLSRPAGAGDNDLFTRSNAAAKQKAENFLLEAKELRELPEPFANIFDPLKMRKDSLLHWLMRSGLVELSTLQAAANEGRVVLVGDAAHALPIVGGQGANAAIEDAVELAQCFSSEGESFDVARYHQSRYTRWKQLRDEAEQNLEKMHFNNEQRSQL